MGNFKTLQADQADVTKKDLVFIHDTLLEMFDEMCDFPEWRGINSLRYKFDEKVKHALQNGTYSGDILVDGDTIDFTPREDESPDQSIHYNSRSNHELKDKDGYEVFVEVEEGGEGEGEEEGQEEEFNEEQT